VRVLQILAGLAQLLLARSLLCHANSLPDLQPATIARRIAFASDLIVGGSALANKRVSKAT
jgi:hypothetical protein